MTPFPIVESPGALDPAGPLDPRVQAELTELSGAPLTHANRVRLLRDGADTYTAMLELIESARTEILLENYIFRADAVGYGYSEALTARARDGVDVRILHDPFGDLRFVVEQSWIGGIARDVVEIAAGREGAAGAGHQ